MAGKPKKPKKKPPTLSVASESQEQYDHWEIAAKRDKRTLSSWVRKLLDDGADASDVAVTSRPRA